MTLKLPILISNTLFQLHISRIGFDSVALCATSSAEMSLCDSLQETTRNILHMHSVEKDRQSSNCGSSNSFKLEIDEHVVTAMNKIYSLKIVTDSALKDYMKYVQSVHIDTLERGEYGKFVTSRSRAIAASSKAANGAVLFVDADSAESTAGAGTVSIHACASTALITTDVTPSVPNGHHEVGMTDSEQQTLVYLSRCKAIASKHVKNMKTNLLSAFSSQEALAWSQGRSRNRIEHTEESGLQASMKHNCESESTYFPGSSIERPVLQPVMSPAECASSVSSHPDEVTKSQKKRSIGDI